MYDFRWKLLSLISVFALLISVGCGDADISGEDDQRQNQNQNQSIDDDDDAIGPEDCDEETEQYNPFNGTCQLIPEEEEEGEQPIEEPDEEDPEENDGPSLGCGMGQLHGQACTTDGTRLPAAIVTVVGRDCDGIPFERSAETDGDGIFYIDNIPGGQHEMLVSSGSFTAERPVDIFEGETNTDLLDEDEKVCVDGDVSIMVVTGSFDDVPELLGGMDLEYETVSDTNVTYFLSDPAEMAEYDIIFFACGTSFSSLSYGSGDLDQMMQNIRQFVESGNSIYASDWSSEYVANSFPEVVNFYDGTTPRIGDGSQTIQADVMSSPMQTLLGSNTAELTFDLGGWVVAESADPPSVVHFRGDAETSQGTIYGASLLTTYSDPIGGGTVVYTSFHNNAQAGAGTQMNDILNFLIFQL